MASKMDIRARLAFWRAALEKMQAAYLALVEGGVKSYALDTGQTLTRFDIPDLVEEIKEAEKKVDELTGLLNGSRPRKAFGIIPRDL